MDNKALSEFVKLEVSKVLAAIDKLSLRLNRVGRQNDLAKTPTAATNEARNSSQVTILSTSPAPIEFQHRARCSKPHRTLRRRTWRHIKRVFFKKDRLERLGVVVGIGYAVVTYLQWRDLQHNFRVEERAWIKRTFAPSIGSTDEFFPLTRVVGQPLSIEIRLHNTGKTPARNVSGYTILRLIPADSNPNFTDLKDANNFGQAFIMPGDFETIFPATIQYKNGREEAQSVPLTAVQDVGISLGKLHIVTFGLATYEDIFGYRHQFHFCQYAVAPGSKPNVEQQKVCVAYEANDNDQ